MATTSTSDGVSIHYETVGDGRDVVLVHGNTDSMKAWGPIPEMLAANDYRVTSLDLRGHGKSADADDYSPVAMAGDVAAVVADAALVSPLVIGHSLGGVVVTAYAASGGARGAINVDQPLHLGGFQAALQQIEPLLRDPATFQETFGAIVDSLDGDVLSDELKAEIAAQRTPRQEVVLAIWDVVLTSPLDELDELIASMTSAIEVPYLALMFSDAGPDYSDWLHQLIPQAVVEEWPGMGHYGHRIDPDQFVATVKAFDPRD